MAAGNRRLWELTFSWAMLGLWGFLRKEVLSPFGSEENNKQEAEEEGKEETQQENSSERGGEATGGNWSTVIQEAVKEGEEEEKRREEEEEEEEEEEGEKDTRGLPLTAIENTQQAQKLRVRLPVLSPEEAWKIQLSSLPRIIPADKATVKINRRRWRVQTKPRNNQPTFTCHAAFTPPCLCVLERSERCSFCSWGRDFRCGFCHACRCAKKTE